MPLKKKLSCNGSMPETFVWSYRRELLRWQGWISFLAHESLQALNAIDVSNLQSASAWTSKMTLTSKEQASVSIFKSFPWSGLCKAVTPHQGGYFATYAGLATEEL